MDTNYDSQRKLARECVSAGIKAAHPKTVITESVSLEGTTLLIGEATFDLSKYESVMILGGGNAASQVAVALESILDERLDGGVVVTDDPAGTECVTVMRGNHPTPSERGVAATERLLETANEVGPDTLVLAVVTGGASALLAAPVAEITLTDLRATTDALLKSGATIHEINSVRKHLSQLKGGRLAARLSPARVATLVFSDVIGNDLSVIGSGPTVPDPTTFSDALNCLDDYDITVPDDVRDYLVAGVAGEHEETPKSDDPTFESVSTHVLADNRTAVDAAARVAAEAGYEPLVLSTRVRGEAREAAKTHVAVAEEAQASGEPVTPPCVVLSGGECTVTVQGDGKGGPNLEFALSGALELPGKTTLCAVDTDGIDGSTDAAGAIVDPETLSNHQAARRALHENNAFVHLDKHDALIHTGPTGTNVNDLRLLFVS